jgi:hypothetical protein
MQDWDVYKQAALDYSRLKPRTVVATITLPADTQIIALPADCLRVRTLVYGDEAEFTEVILGDGSTQAWAAAGTQLAIVPTVAEDTPVQIIYSGRHLPDEDAQAFPTIPAADLGYVDDLEQAYLLDLQADDISGGPVAYSVGQTQVSREAAIADLRARALQLRTHVELALDEPFALWS